MKDLHLWIRKIGPWTLGFNLTFIIFVGWFIFAVVDAWHTWPQFQVETSVDPGKPMQKVSNDMLKLLHAAF